LAAAVNCQTQALCLSDHVMACGCISLVFRISTGVFDPKSCFLQHQPTSANTLVCSYFKSHGWQQMPQTVLVLWSCSTAPSRPFLFPLVDEKASCHARDMGLTVLSLRASCCSKANPQINILSLSYLQCLQSVLRAPRSVFCRRQACVARNLSANARWKT
jgi:hypothetical protein